MKLSNNLALALTIAATTVSTVTPYGSDLPSAFEQVQIGSTAGGTDIEFSPTDGTMLVTTKEGKILVFREPGVSDDKYVGLDLGPSGENIMCSNGERALASITLHPKFGKDNRYIYLYYAFDKPGNQECLESETDGPVNRFSRWTMDEDYMVDLDSELVIFDTGPLPFDHHNSGDSFFGKDGYLYVGVGDGGSYDVSQDNSNIFGCILRLNEDGSTPDDNPFMDNPNVESCLENGVVPSGNTKDGVCGEIFASGLRNPWRIVPNPDSPDGKVEFMINDVGEIKWEEVSMGGTDYAGANYGWPDREGPCRRTTISDCAIPGPQFGWTEPFYFYQHGMQNDGAITGGAYIPKGIGWGDEWEGKYLFSEFIFGTIQALDLEEREGYNCRTCIPPISNRKKTDFFTHDRVVHMSFGPYKNTQALYYVSRDRSINRIAYVGESNFKPVVVLTASVLEGPPPLTVTFDSEGTTDPNANDELSYEWDFTSDGVVDSTEPSASYTFTENGVYEVTLTVKDNNGGQSSKSVMISVGNKPTCTITSPAEGSTFAVGDIITVSGTAVDAEDGQLDPQTALTWEVQQHHGNHWHPFLDPTDGNDITISAAPEPEDYIGATNSFLRVLCTATDSQGLQSTTYRDVLPRKLLIDFDTMPPGLEVKVAGANIETPVTVTSWENSNLLIEALDQTFQNKRYTFFVWSDGGAQSHEILVPSQESLGDGVRMKFVASFSDGYFTYTESPTKEPTGAVVTTPSPTAAPVVAPTTDAPVSVPTTDAPIVSPTETPVTQPTDSPVASQPDNNLPSDAVPGIEVHYFELNSEVSEIPNFNIMVPYKTEVVSNVNYEDTMGDFAGSGRNKLVAAKYEGLLVFPSSGVYTLYLDSDDGSRLYINDELVVEKNVIGPMGKPVSGTVTVSSKTVVDIRIEYYENDGGAGLILSWSGPTIGETPTVIPSSAYYRIPSTPIPEGLQQGVLVHYYEIGDIASLPDFESMTPYMMEVVPDINFVGTFEEFAGSGRSSRVGAVFEGYLKFPSTGEYTLSLDSDDGSKLEIDNKLVIDNDIIGPMGNPVTGFINVGDDVAFTKNLGTTQFDSTLVTIRVEFFENTGGAGLILKWAGPNDDELTPIPRSAFYHILPETPSPTAAETEPGSSGYMNSPTLSMGLMVLVFMFGALI